MHRVSNTCCLSRLCRLPSVSSIPFKVWNLQTFCFASLPWFIWKQETLKLMHVFNFLRFGHTKHRFGWTKYRFGQCFTGTETIFDLREHLNFWNKFYICSSKTFFLLEKTYFCLEKFFICGKKTLYLLSIEITCFSGKNFLLQCSPLKVLDSFVDNCAK